MLSAIVQSREASRYFITAIRHAARLQWSTADTLPPTKLRRAGWNGLELGSTSHFALYFSVARLARFEIFEVWSYFW